MGVQNRLLTGRSASRIGHATGLIAAIDGSPCASELTGSLSGGVRHLTELDDALGRFLEQTLMRHAETAAV
jgi:hypothetical protein